MKSALLVIPLLVFSVSAAAIPRIIEGMWVITTEMNMPVIPGIRSLGSSENTQRQCLTNKNLIPDLSNQSGQNCRTVKSSVSGDTVSWAIECDSNGTISIGRGSITYKVDSMHGTTEMSINSPFEKDKRVKMITRIRGRWIGECRN